MTISTNPTQHESSEDIIDLDEAMAQFGLSFNGNLWLFIAETAPPNRATCLVGAFPAEAVANSAGMLGTQFALADTPMGHVLGITASLPNLTIPSLSVSLTTFFNPCEDGPRTALRRLAAQPTVSAHLCDPHGGGAIVRTVSVETETRQAIHEILQLTEGAPSAGARFPEAAELMDRHMPPPPQVARASRPRTGRNQPCPCGSMVKFKRCCGRGRS